MSWFIGFLVFVHLFSLALGIGAGIGASRVGPLLGAASGDDKSGLVTLGTRLWRLANIGIGLLWVSGVLIILAAFQQLGGLSPWFWVKIVLVIIYSGTVGMSTAAFREFAKGDNSASGKLAMLGWANAVLGALIVLTAVLAFH